VVLVAWVVARAAALRLFEHLGENLIVAQNTVRGPLAKRHPYAVFAVAYLRAPDLMNIRTANAISIPPSLLLRADHVIE
jgi:hypothetical protein